MRTEEASGLAGLRRFHVVPHTHWDREWYAPLEAFQLRLAAVVDEVIDVLESDPTFTSFTLDGQAIVLEDYVEARPENESRLRALLRAGRLEVGPSYILLYELLVGAEPLVRNLLIGRAVCERFGARPAPVGYMPDSFGHPLQLPQILAGFGIDSFIFSRGLGDELDDLGVVFRWRSLDGSEVRAFQQLPHYGNFVVGDADDAQARTEEIADRFGRRSAAPASATSCSATARTTAGSGPTCRLCAPSSSAGSRERDSRSPASATTSPKPPPANCRPGRESCSEAVSRTSCAGSTPPGSTSSRPTSARSDGCSRSKPSVCCAPCIRASGFRPPTSGSRGASCSSASRTTRSAAARATRCTTTCSSGMPSSTAPSHSSSGARSTVSPLRALPPARSTSSPIAGAA